jgi:hypothetical protein
MMKGGYLIAVVVVLLFSGSGNASATAQRYDGFNLIAVPKHPFGSAGARAALTAIRQACADTVAIVPFLWQRDPAHSGIVRGADMPDDALRAAIRDTHERGLKVLVKPQVWVDGSWAGRVEPDSPDGWRIWLERYRAAILRIAQVADGERAEAFSIGTELERTTHRPEWRGIVAAARAIYPGLLTYAAHNLEEAEAVPFWSALDAIGVTLYPPLGSDGDHAGRLAVMRAAAERLDRLAARLGKPVIVTEIGIRSAVGAAARPWESAEERVASPSVRLQADVLSDWLAVLRRPSVSGVLIWRWLTDPSAGGPRDTDFTVQGKPAERVFASARTPDCHN